jgi:hypothetical protein
MRLTVKSIKETRSVARLLAVLSASGPKTLKNEPIKPQGGDQLIKPDDIQDPPEIVSERRQAELGANLLQATHQKRALVHPLLDSSKRVFDSLSTAVKDTGVLRQPGLHPVQHRFVLKPRYRAELATRALPADRAIVAG